MFTSKISWSHQNPHTIIVLMNSLIDLCLCLPFLLYSHWSMFTLIILCLIILTILCSILPFLIHINSIPLLISSKSNPNIQILMDRSLSLPVPSLPIDSILTFYPSLGREVFAFICQLKAHICQLKWGPFPFPFFGIEKHENNRSSEWGEREDNQIERLECASAIATRSPLGRARPCWSRHGPGRMVVGLGQTAQGKLAHLCWAERRC